MDTEMRKRLEEAAKSKNPYSKYNGEWMQGYLSGMYEEGFLAGAELGYKEAIAQCKEWLKEHIVDEDGTCFDEKESSYLTYEEFASNFEADMNKLWEEKK